ncbi:uncharacterized protein LOC100891419 [Strongylocentrotus purpuratus]|uniref:Uncharacterized protein n=1 Tax=Strongylocentrotus purpuratus TaxID=7668 RepID=A0A7M7GJQ1_STRPU|nr:uncharacterized protein LOC100891419 [Strongylocentrotus purpuratus]|eukprot:XP_003724276.1 PREDICTED: uncharacterized protein LOC100891419 [Strongylocentrotus purpuratus]
MVLTMGDDFYRQRTATSGRRVRRESDARRDLERMHLMTIRREKMRLQEELDRVRVKGGGKAGMSQASKNAQLLSSRFVTTANDKGASQRRTRLRISTATSPQRATSPYVLRRNTTNTKLGSSMNPDKELPQIGYMATPLTGELDSRRLKDEVRDPKTKINELKKNEGQQKKLLSLKVDMFTRSLSPVSIASARSPGRSPVHSPTSKPEDKHPTMDDVDVTSSDYVFSPRATFPPGAKKRGHFDISNTRLVPIDVEVNGMGSDHGLTQRDDVLPTISNTQIVPTPLPSRPTVIRRQSQVAILERNDQKKNKYATTKDSKDSSRNNNSKGDAAKLSVESELNLAVLGRDAKRVKEIIENPDIVFDQQKYAPDGALRTVHMLPPADNAFSQARQARYLRWRDPNETNRERELTVSEIFAKGTNSF